jgi:NAD(P)H-hydrate epimerase
VAEFLLAEFGKPEKVTVLCGKGNNGGDGFVAARYLLREGITPNVILFAEPEALQGDAKTNFDAYLKAGGKVENIVAEKEWEARREELLTCNVVLDAMLGTGLSGPPRGLAATVVSNLNDKNRSFLVLAVDIPSGLASDSGEPLGEAVRADACVTFTAPKHGQVFPPNCLQVGELAVAPIGSPEGLYSEDPELFLNLVNARQLQSLPTRRDPQAHKGSYGHALIVAGSRGKTGAAALAGRAALRTGAGLVTVATPASVLPTVAAPAPELMTEPLEETGGGTVSLKAFDYGRFARIQEGKTVLAMGPGLSTHPETVEFVRSVVAQTELPLVLDADALNALVGALDVLGRRKTETVVLTPHPGEMARLLGTSSEEVQRNRVEVARSLAADFGVFVILKGYRTLLAAPSGQVFVNPTGGPGLAKGGSGDVLTGILAGVLAQFPGERVEDVLSLGVYLHGAAGDRATESLGEQSVLASDIIDSLPAAWQGVRERIDHDTLIGCQLWRLGTGVSLWQSGSR